MTSPTVIENLSDRIFVHGIGKDIPLEDHICKGKTTIYTTWTPDRLKPIRDHLDLSSQPHISNPSTISTATVRICRIPLTFHLHPTVLSCLPLWHFRTTIDLQVPHLLAINTGRHSLISPPRVVQHIPLWQTSTVRIAKGSNTATQPPAAVRSRPSKPAKGIPALDP